MSGNHKPVKRKAAGGRTLKKASGSRPSTPRRQPHRKTTGTDPKGRKPAPGPMERRLSLIAQVTGAVVGSHPLRRRAEAMARQVCSAFGADGCVIRLLEGEELVLLARAGMPKKNLYTRLPSDFGVAGMLISHRHPLFIPKVPCLPPVTARLRPYHFTSYAGAPLIAQDRVIGILGMYWMKPYRNFGDADMGYLQIIANSIAAAVTNDKLYEEMRRQKDQLEAETTERARAEALLRENEKAHLDQIRRLARDTERHLEEERAKVSRHLHDGVGQSLTSLLMRLAWVGKRVSAAAPALEDELKQASEQAALMIDDIRAVAKSLRPVAIEHEGLIPAIRSYIADFQRLSGIQCRVVTRPHDSIIREPFATTIFRILQEAMTNVARHAHASGCDIRLNASRDQLELTVHDSGRGAKSGRLEGHRSLGILGMKERASAVGGNVHVQNGPKAGVLVRACFPLRNAKTTAGS